MPVIFQRRFSDVRVHDAEVAPPIESGSGNGGNNLPMVLQTLVFDLSQVTSKYNYSHPKWNDSCHPLTQEASRAIMIIKQGNGIGRSDNDGGRNMRNNQHVFESHSQDSRYNPMGEICETISAKYGTGGNNQPIVAYAVPIEGNGTRPSHEGNGFANPGEPSFTINVAERHAVATNQTVRKLTPLECERLQGFPDGWTDIGEWVDTKCKKHKEADSPRYKALGNSIATPFWFYLLRRISATYERPATLGSLFDGIGGFPLCWEKCNGKGTAIWASEIEEFPIAVTKIRFPE